MKLYFSPGACSLAPHIIVREAGLKVDLEKVTFSDDARSAEGRDFYTINPLGAVPALGLDGGEVLTENAVILQYLAEQAPQSGLGPPATGMARWRFLGASLRTSPLRTSPLLGWMLGQHLSSLNNI